MKVNYKNISLIFGILLMVTATGWGQDLPSTCGGSRVRYGVSGLPSSTFNWEVTGGTIIANYNDSIDVQWEVVEGIKTIRVTEYTQGNCVAAPVLAHVVVGASSVNIGDIAQICEGDSFTFVPDIVYEVYNWSTGETTSSIVAKTTGTYWLEITDKYGCKGRDSAELVVNPKPNVSLGMDTILFPDQTMLLNAGSGGAEYKWSTGDISQTIETGGKDDPIWVSVTSDKGCINGDTISITVRYKIPNAFTPNGDGDNDTWHVQWLEAFPEATVEIFDRWGRLVFKQKGFPTEGWDGRSNGRALPMDSYYYILDLKNGKEPIVGNVTIIR